MTKVRWLETTSYYLLFAT